MANHEVPQSVPHSTEHVERREFAPVERTGAGQTFIHQNGDQSLHAINQMDKPTSADHQHVPPLKLEIHDPAGAEQTPKPILPTPPADQADGSMYRKTTIEDGAMNKQPTDGQLPAPGSDTIPIPPIPKPIDY